MESHLQFLTPGPATHFPFSSAAITSELVLTPKCAYILDMGNMGEGWSGVEGHLRKPLP